MKMLKKVLIVLMIALMCMSCVATTSQAASKVNKQKSKTPKPKEVAVAWNSTEQFDGNYNTTLNSKTTKIVGSVVSVIRIVGTGIAIIMLAFVAIKYMSSAPGDRAEIKKHAVVYVVGAIVLFATAGILGIIEQFASSI